MPENYICTQTENGSISISDEVISRIVLTAASEIEGVAGFTSVIGNDLADLLGIKNVPRGFKVTMQEDKAVVDIVLMVRYGYPVTSVAHKVQSSVCRAIEDMTGLATLVNVHVSGISFEKSEIK